MTAATVIATPRGRDRFAVTVVAEPSHPVPDFHPADPDRFWANVAAIRDAQLSREAMDFVADSRNAIPVLAELRQGETVCGFFAGLIETRMGIRILGSPFPRWMIPCMGFALYPGIPATAALTALERFAFDTLGCAHVEILDRRVTIDDAREAGYLYSAVQTYESDLTHSEARLFADMKSACRRCIRKAEKMGVTVEEVGAADPTFAVEYYAQLKDGLLTKALVPSYDVALVQSFIHHMIRSGRLLLLRARDPEGRCIGTGIYPAIGSTAYLWGNVASYSTSRQLRPTEALNWYALRYWKARGAQRFDWGGLGRHKEKYGGTPITLLRLRKSRSGAIRILRQLAEAALRRRLQLRGRVAAWWNTASSR